MKIEIITPDRKVLSGDVDSTTLPGAMGSFQVLRNHADLISALEKGPIKVKSSAGADTTVTISGGVVEVLDNKITVLAESVIED
jgi:F-type H+-transporting ATPase subunit epsilon